MQGGLLCATSRSVGVWITYFSGLLYTQCHTQLEINHFTAAFMEVIVLAVENIHVLSISVPF